MKWQYFVLDDGLHFVNPAGKYYNLVRELSFGDCTLLTSNAIEINVEELWAVLRLLHPESFADLPDFLTRFGNIGDIDVLTQLHELVKPLILRRHRREVRAALGVCEVAMIECEFTHIQKKQYRMILADNGKTLVRATGHHSLPSLSRLALELRKVCTHAFLSMGPLEPNISDRRTQKKLFVEASRKFEKLLPTAFDRNEKVVIFCQLVPMLDILEQYFSISGYRSMRIDDWATEDATHEAVRRFTENASSFIQLLWRKLPLGEVNAQFFVVYDTQWLSQTDPVSQRVQPSPDCQIFRLVTRGSCELAAVSHCGPLSARALERMLRQGVQVVMRLDESEIKDLFRRIWRKRWSSARATSVSSPHHGKSISTTHGSSGSACLRKSSKQPTHQTQCCICIRRTTRISSSRALQTPASLDHS
jgi:chromodomain-helicase-DNA-binding protein 1